MDMVARAPRTFTVTPRNPDRMLPLGGKALLFGNVSSPPNYWDMERGKVSGFMDGFRDFIKLTQYFNCIHFAGGYPVEPVDVHASVRHLDCLYEKLTLTDKVVHAYSLGKERIEDAMEMVRIAGGLTPGGIPCQAADVHQHQLRLAAEARLSDDRRRAALCAGRAAGRRDALHAGGRDGARHDVGCGGPVHRRGAVGHRAAAIRGPRRHPA